MKDDKKRLIGVRVDQELHKRMKIYTAERDITLQDYLMELIEKDMEQRKPKGGV